MGEVKLNGEQALNFIRTRKDVGDQLNISRMERHRSYMDGWIEAFRIKTKENSSFILNLYEQVLPYIVTDCSVNTIGGMLERFDGYTINEIITPDGYNVMGKEYFEFYVDAEKLDALILKLFYAPKK